MWRTCVALAGSDHALSSPARSVGASLFDTVGADYAFADFPAAIPARNASAATDP